jgi:hypothetical protein
MGCAVASSVSTAHARRGSYGISLLGGTSACGVPASICIYRLLTAPETRTGLNWLLVSVAFACVLFALSVGAGVFF